MNKITRNILIGTLISVFILGNAFSVFASSNQSEDVLTIITADSSGILEEHSYSLDELQCDTYGADGHLMYSPLATTIGKSTISSGSTKNYYPKGTTGFNVSKNVVVTVKLKLNKAARLSTKLENSAALETTDKNPTILLTPTSSTRAKLCITNKSGSSVTINSGTVDW